MPLRYTYIMTDPSAWRINQPNLSQREDVLALFPRLSGFDLPENRDPAHLWQHDAAMAARWFDGNEPGVRLLVALDQSGTVAGVAMLSLRPELLSHTPSAHLEALAVAQKFEAQGVGTALLDACDKQARDLGAQSITLHVFDSNERALRLYRHKGYVPELRRCIKWL